MFLIQAYLIDSCETVDLLQFSQFQNRIYAEFITQYESKSNMISIKEQIKYLAQCINEPAGILNCAAAKLSP